MFIHSVHRPASLVMKRFPFFFCLAILFLLILTGITSAESPADTTTTDIATPTDITTTTSDRIGGSIYFRTEPADATIWLDNVEIGTSPFTYYSEKTGTFDVRIQRKWYEDYADTVTVVEGKRVDFYARLTPVSPDTTEAKTPAARVTTTTALRKSTVNVPTPWPTSPAESPVDPAVIIGAAALGIWLFVIRRR
jgi:hypothetical protein